MGTRQGQVFAATAALLCGALLATVPSLSAQSRFEALKQDTVPEVAGLRVITLRDTLLDACYTLFMMEPVGPPAGAPQAPPIDEARQQAIDRIRDAAERHDQQVAELSLQFQSKTGLTPEMARIPGLAVARNVSLADYLVKYDVERMKADSEYEGVLRTEIPGSLPFATATPGTKTGSWEDAAEAIRRAVTNPDPGQFKTLADAGGFNSQLTSILQHMADAPRMAASGPAPCNAAKPAASAKAESAKPAAAAKAAVPAKPAASAKKPDAAKAQPRQ